MLLGKKPGQDERKENPSVGDGRMVA